VFICRVSSFSQLLCGETLSSPHGSLENFGLPYFTPWVLRLSKSVTRILEVVEKNTLKYRVPVVFSLTHRLLERAGLLASSSRTVLSLLRRGVPPDRMAPNRRDADDDSADACPRVPLAKRLPSSTDLLAATTWSQFRGRTPRRRIANVCNEVSLWGSVEHARFTFSPWPLRGFACWRRTSTCHSHADGGPGRLHAPFSSSPIYTPGRLVFFFMA